jgi:hypothetical protein
LAWASIGVNVFLSLLNLGIAFASGSLAVAAELVHNLTYLVSSVRRSPSSCASAKPASGFAPTRGSAHSSMRHEPGFAGEDPGAVNPSHRGE